MIQVDRWKRRSLLPSCQHHYIKCHTKFCKIFGEWKQPIEVSKNMIFCLHQLEGAQNGFGLQICQVKATQYKQVDNIIEMCKKHHMKINVDEIDILPLEFHILLKIKLLY